VPEASNHNPGREPGTPGDHFGRYRLLELIGKGGMAEVFRAVGPAGANAAEGGFVIKRIRPDRSDSPRFVQMFCDEARISALLDHPNIVRVFDFGQIEGAYFMAMEYLDGHDLGAVLHATRARGIAVPPPVAAFVAREVARALQHAHAATLPDGAPGGIVHRDVSPGNVMLLRSGGVKILDFGIAKAATLARPSNDAGGAPAGLAGHLSYLSPEQIRGVDVDRRADVFSLGAVLAEMLIGQRLFAGKNEYETMHNVLQLPVADALSPLAGALRSIVRRSLRRDPDKRYQTAGEMADDLGWFLADNPCAPGAVATLLGDLFTRQSSSARSVSTSR
jgi:serine/threonine-protein kinase